MPYEIEREALNLPLHRLRRHHVRRSHLRLPSFERSVADRTFQKHLRMCSVQSVVWRQT